jgi:hypothetical protein
LLLERLDRVGIGCLLLSDCCSFSVREREREKTQLRGDEE